MAWVTVISTGTVPGTGTGTSTDMIPVPEPSRTYYVVLPGRTYLDSVPGIILINRANDF